MGQALYRYYRPKSLADVVGQEHITVTLQHALEQDKLAHAYLFTGPRGVGKTSIARILAHQINGLPYEDDSMHLDIIEIDAASNRRIDEIRELRDKVNIAPSLARYKVYIIDEVHMLTREAFNALLKTLEEPPAHAVFILATTESHKLPETIVSRTQRFIFKPVSQDKVVAHLRSIAEQEAIAIDDEALQLIAAHGEGSFRDSISLLDQTRGHDGAVDADVVRTLIGIPTDAAIEEVCTALDSSDAVALSRVLARLRSQGFAAPQTARHLARQLRQEVLDGRGRAGVFDLLGKLLEVPVAYDPETYLELTLLSYALAGSIPAVPVAAAAAAGPRPAAVPAAPVANPVQPAPRPATVPAPDRPATMTAPAAISFKPATGPEPAVQATPAPEPPAADEPPARRGQPVAVDDKLWPEVLNSLKKSHNTLYGIARMAQPTFYDGLLELGFSFAFHKKRVSENKNKEVICGIIKSLTGQDMALECILIGKGLAPAGQPPVPQFDDPPAASAASTAPPAAGTVNPKALNAITDVFGGAEVLQN